MARPLSEIKRNALLDSALTAVATSGLGASTLKIAKDAGVAEGTLFRYFSTKDDLLKQLYLKLKTDLVNYLSVGLPLKAGIEEQFRHLWNRFIDWGASDPNKHKALRQLEVSLLISEASLDESRKMSQDLIRLMERGFETGVLRKQPIPFFWGIIQSVATLVLDTAAGDVKKIREGKKLGWETLWGAIAQHPPKP